MREWVRNLAMKTENGLYDAMTANIPSSYASLHHPEGQCERPIRYPLGHGVLTISHCDLAVHR